MISSTKESTKLILAYESGETARNFRSLNRSAADGDILKTAEAINSLQAEACTAVIVRESYFLSEE